MSLSPVGTTVAVEAITRVASVLLQSMEGKSEMAIHLHLFV